jgi:hypothetical protein
MFFFSFTLFAFAKKVKFAVDLTGQPISPNGVHITGDFQEIAGFPGGDWTSDGTPLTQEGTSAIYSIIIDLPAFRKYEYKFVNGDQFYEAEFIPIASRVGYDFNDNRWIYVDSTSADTSFVGAIRFGENAPEGKKMIRLLVDMKNESSSPEGIFVNANLPNWNINQSILYRFIDNIYEAIFFVDAGLLEYQFANGRNNPKIESVPNDCAVNNYRSINIVADTVLSGVCFSSCNACNITSTDHLSPIIESLEISPNPASDLIHCSFINNPTGTLELLNPVGQTISTFQSNGLNQITMNVASIKSGIYFIRYKTEKNNVYQIKKVTIQ